jgi:tRNA threonylcarbamoyladenosine biosynthesis protein TsaB
MKILALEFSATLRSAALIISGGGGERPGVRSLISDAGDRSITPLRLVEQVLKGAALAREEITHLAISAGPGSYTGIRAAIATAQGWQLARAVPIIALTVMEGLALRAQQNGWRGSVRFALDAQRGEFYSQGWQITEAERQPATPLQLVSRNEVLASSEGTILAGPNLAETLPGARELMPEAGALGLAAWERPSVTPGEKLEPVYLRETAFVKAPPLRLIP